MQTKFQIPDDIREQATQRLADNTKRMMDAIFSNERIVDNIVAREASEVNLAHIKGIITICQQIDPIKIENVDARVNIYPVNEARFGKELGSLLGLITTAASALEQHQEAMLAYTGISPILAEKVRNALGTVPYFSKKSKIVVDGTVGNAEDLRALILEVASMMNLNYIDTSVITQQQLELMYTKGKLKAETAKAMHERLSTLSANEAFQYSE